MYEKRSPLTIRSLFDNIAPRYDLANSLLSFHMHALWNQKLVNSLIEHGSQTLLDLCSGTGEISFRLVRKAQNAKKSCPHITLYDFSPEMLKIADARKKKFTFDIQEKLTFTEGNAEKLHFQDASFDAVSCAYGIRNIQDLKSSFSEVFRVLKPGGLFAIVELTRPKNRLMKSFHSLYLKTFVPFIGKLFVSNKEAYSYLNRSIKSFLSPEEVQELAKKSGFEIKKIVPLTLGVATIFLFLKN